MTGAPICEVVVSHDVRARNRFALRDLHHRYFLRRAVSAAFLIVVDVVAVVLAVMLAPSLWSIVHVQVDRPLPREMLVAALIVVSVAALCGMYGQRARRSGLLQVMRSGIATLLAIGAVMMVASNTIHSESAVCIWMLWLTIDYLLRAAYDVGLRLRFGHAHVRRPALLIGDTDHSHRVAEQFQRSSLGAELRIAGMVTDELPAAQREPGRLRRLGCLDDLENVVERLRPVELIITDPHVVSERMVQIHELCRSRHLTLRMAAPDLAFDGTAVSFVPGFGMPVFVVKEPTRGGAAFLAKRAADLITSALLLVVLSPLLLVIAALIKLSSKGPILYGSERVGLGQRHFTCHKFRTMNVGADRCQADLEACNEASGALFKMRDDPRVTPIGRFLRRYSLDELPQLFNVLRGQMSIVGPRPLPVRDNHLMEDWHKRRHLVLPGITGPWQANGRSDLSFEDMIDLDFRYIENWSLLEDLRIIARTVSAVVLRRGAY